jgi:hypothetical protein
MLGLNNSICYSHYPNIYIKTEKSTIHFGEPDQNPKKTKETIKVNKRQLPH